MAVTAHIRDTHAIPVTHARPDGWMCRVEGCGLWFGAYRAWRGHTSNVHINVVPPAACHDVPSALHMPVPAHLPVDDGHNGNGDDGDGDDGDSDDHDLNRRLGEIERGRDGERNIKHACTKMVVEMRSVSAMTRVGVRRAMAGSEGILEINNRKLKRNVEDYLQVMKQAGTPRAQALLSKLEVESPFKGMKSNKGQIPSIKRFHSYIEPESKFIHDRNDLRLQERSAFAERDVPNSYHFVSP